MPNTPVISVIGRKITVTTDVLKATLDGVGGSLVRLESGRLGVVTEQNESSLLTPRVRTFFSTKSNGYIKPEVVDLGRKLGSGGGDRIVSAEAPDKWGVDPTRFLIAE